MRKNIVKKTLAAGMLALMACTSMSAMAASEWVWTSQELRGAGETFDEICEAVVASRAHTAGPWKVEYLGSWYLVSDRTVYCRAINELDNQNFVAGGFVCDKGKFFFNDSDRPDGCYEYIDCDPSLYARQAMPEACKQQSCEADRKEMVAGNIPPNEECCTPEPFPENGSMCGENPPENVGGAVACNPNDRSDTQLCTWLKGGYNDPQAESIIINGAIAHEKIHDKDTNYSCKKIGEEHYLGGNEGDPAKPYGEMMGSIEEMKYLEENIQTCCTQSCVDDIKKRHRDMIGYCRTFAYDYFELTNEYLISMCNRVISY